MAEAARVRLWKIKRSSRRGSGRGGGHASNPGLFCGHPLRLLTVIRRVSLPHDVSNPVETINSSSDDVSIIIYFISILSFCLLSKTSNTAQKKLAVVAQPQRTEEEMLLLQLSWCIAPTTFLTDYTVDFFDLNPFQCSSCGRAASLCAWKFPLRRSSSLERHPRPAAETGRGGLRPTLPDGSPVLYHRGGRLNRGRPACHISSAWRFRPQLKLPRDSRPLRLGCTARAHCAVQDSYDDSAF